MKITSIEISNLASLRGKHIINFEKELFDEGLFAITGPTGSGKSTIINAISLCLYGKTYKTTLSAPDFVSIGSEEGSCSVSFLINNMNYTASWACKVLKKSGEFIKKPSPKREFYEEDKISESNPENILKLSFDQFSKSIILNQGQFSKFLMSSFSERKDILEKLYTGDDIAPISKIINEQLKELRSNAGRFDSIIESGLPIGKEEFLEISTSLKQKEEKYKLIKIQNEGLMSSGQKLEKILEVIQTIKVSSNKLKENKEKLLNADSIYIKNKNVFKSLEENYIEAKKNHESKAPKLKRCIELLQKLHYLQKLKDENTNNKNSLISEIKSAESKVNDLIVEINLGHNKINQVLETAIFDKNIDKEQTKNFINRIIQLTENNKLLRENFDLFKAQEEKQIVTLKEIDLELQSLDKEIISIIPDKDVSTAQKSIDQINNDLFRIKDIEALKIDTTSEINKNNQLLSEFLKSKDDIDLAKKKSEDKIEVKLKQIKESKEYIKSNQKLKQIEDLISDSINDSNCHICDRAISEELAGKIQEKVKNINIKQKEIELESLEQDITNLRKININKEKELATISEKILYAKDKISSLNNKELENTSKLKEISKTYKIEDISDLTNTLEAKLISFNLAKEKIIKLNSKSVQKDTIKNEYKQATTQKSKIISQLDINKYSLEELKLEISSLMIKKEGQYNTDELLTHLNKFLELLNRSDEINSKIKENEARKEYFSKVKEDKSISLKKIEIALEKIIDEFDENQNNLDKIKITLEPAVELKLIEDALTSSIEQKDKFHKTLIDSQKIKDQYEHFNKSIKTQLEEQETILTDLHQGLKDFKLTLEDEQIQKTFSNINLIKNNSDLIESSEIIGFLYNDLLSPKIMDTKVLLDSLKDEIITNKTKIDLYEKKKKDLDSAIESLKSISIKLARLEKLSTILGKEEFRNFALGIIEEQLVAQTNSELEQLCEGRYEIFHSKGKRGHDFYIVDNFSGGMIRKVSTLSGGETFLVSLAMALGLSEMMRGQTQIDSFFIDEGFGGLDSNSIGEVFDALMNIRNRGKQIGIISHVKELTTRIGVNINLEKNNSGNSTIHTMYN